MADPPPPIAGTEAEWAKRGGRSVPEEEWRNSLEITEVSGEEEDVSDYSDCPSDGSYDAAMEYQKDLEEQRIADEKNGHFADDRNRNPSMDDRKAAPEIEHARVSMAAPTSRVSLASHKAKALAKHAMNLDTNMHEGGGEKEGKICENLAVSKPSTIQIQSGKEGFDFEKLKSAENIGRIMTERGGKDLQPRLHEIRDSQMEGSNLGGGGEGKFDSHDTDMAENLAVKRGRDLLSHLEENNHLDLVEVRPLAVQNSGAQFSTGPPPLGSINESSDQPNNRKNAASKFYISKSAATFKNTLLTQSKNNSQAPSKPKPPFPSAQNKNNSPLPKLSLSSAQNKINSQLPQPNSTPRNNQPAASLPIDSRSDEQTRKNASMPQSQSAAISDHDMLEFPPLESSEHARKNLNVGSTSESSNPTSAPFRTPQLTPHLSSSQPDATNFKSRWADLMEEDETAQNAEANNTPESVRREQSETAPGAQPNIHFGRSMADVLRSGQPAEGPILLDRERADKRGEVRIVEGKPCLYFLVNETSMLAGRLGPAIVGKFSHSIPPAHQIQKALGNLKLVGAMTWNFLNAKHIFIQLSDMRDYVKMLNGPNNSPVWYVDHHPMRVFKWTPDFDPYFESPIVTLWCSILALPVHLFEESSLIAIGEMLGKPVQVDRATITRTRVSFARICVEVDLTRPIPDKIDISIEGRHVTLKVKWDKIPLYCNECKHVGHSATTCYAYGKRPMPPKKDYSFGPSPQSRPAPNREGESRPPEESLAASFAAGRQPEVPQRQPNARQATERPPPEANQPMRQEGRNKGKEVPETPTGCSRRGVTGCRGRRLRRS